MKNLDLNSMGVQELNAFEMQETDGGVIWFIVIAAAVFLTSCNIETNIQVGGSNNSIQTSDSTQNGWSADSTMVNLNLKPM
jgi:hypothetical protein